LGFGIEKSAWIATLGVKPEYMGQGIGKNLAMKIFEYYKSEGIENVYTSVRWDSPDLLSFFKTMGFDRSNFINLRKSI
jgi:N-acetylglutamate synthase-like GNAT family acetyltransferase